MTLSLLFSSGVAVIGGKQANRTEQKSKIHSTFAAAAVSASASAVGVGFTFRFSQLWLPSFLPSRTAAATEDGSVYSTATEREDTDKQTELVSE